MHMGNQATEWPLLIYYHWCVFLLFHQTNEDWASFSRETFQFPVCNLPSPEHSIVLMATVGYAQALGFGGQFVISLAYFPPLTNDMIHMAQTREQMLLDT